MNLSINNIKIVLIGTTHPGNIGAAARAMKTMGQSNLFLVNPKIFPSAEATARATGADDVLAKAHVVSGLKEAISDCDFIIGTTARERSIPWPTMTPRDCVNHVANENFRSIAILFGRESSGLSNEEIEHCNTVIKIPANAEYSSLNLAAAVQIICYEFLLLNYDNKKDQKEEIESRITSKKMEQFYEHLQQCMSDVGYYDEDNPRKLMYRVRRIFNRINLDESEYNIMRGFLSKIQNKINNK